jgi:hypothetical protein
MGTGTATVGPIQVNIVKHAVSGKDRGFVVPPHVAMGTGTAKVPSVRWINGTGGSARLWFPNGDEVFQPPAGGFSNPIEIPPGGLTLQVKASPNAGDYHYHVYCDSLKECAQGNSEPRISVS